MTVIWHNGTFKKEEPIFSFSDRIRLGDGVFDTMLAIDGYMIYSGLHYERLVRHAGLLGIPVNLKQDAFERNVGALFERNNYMSGQYVVNTLISRGPGERGIAPPANPDVQIAIRVTPAPKEIPPLHAVIPKTTRRNEGSPLSQIKSVNYGVMVMALQEADKTGANEAILLNNKGLVTCATSSNIFVVKGKKLYTPPLSDGLMDGIVRRLVMERFPVIEKSLKPEHLFKSDGVYLTNSIKGVQPLRSLDGKQLPEPVVKIEKDFHYT